MQKIVERLKALCEKNNTSITKLCKEITGSSGNLPTWNNGNIRTDYLIKIAQKFNVSTDSILGLPDKFPDSSESLNDSVIKAIPHVIAYIDILGTKNKLNTSENAIVEIINDIKYSIKYSLDELNEHFSEKFNSQAIKYKIFSDNIAIAVVCEELSEKARLTYNLAVVIAKFQYDFFLKRNILLRGAICYGNLYIDSISVIGNGLVKAYNFENQESKYPCIIIEPTLFDEMTFYFEEVKMHYGKNKDCVSAKKYYDNFKSLFKKISSKYYCVDPKFLLTDEQDYVAGRVILDKMLYAESDIDVREKINWFKSFWQSTKTVNVDVENNTYLSTHELNNTEVPQSNALSGDESKMLSIYRQLDAFDKGNVIGYINGLLVADKYLTEPKEARIKLNKSDDAEFPKEII